MNYFGSVSCTKAVIRVMKERHHGRVVFLASQAAHVGLFGYSAYAASKFALRGLAESIQMEVRTNLTGRPGLNSGVEIWKI